MYQKTRKLTNNNELSASIKDEMDGLVKQSVNRFCETNMYKFIILTFGVAVIHMHTVDGKLCCFTHQFNFF